MSKTPDAREAALVIIEKLMEAQPAFDALNEQMSILNSGTTTMFAPMAECVADKVVDLLDIVLGEELASYFLYDCQCMGDGGSIKEIDGTVWPLKTIANLRTYVNRPTIAV
jgi:hypothetical protein